MDRNPSPQPSPRGRGSAVPMLLQFASALLRLTGEAFEQSLDLPVLLALAVSPFADHLLLGAHVGHEALDGFGEARHGRRRRLAAAALFECRAQPVDRALKIAA